MQTICGNPTPARTEAPLFRSTVPVDSVLLRRPAGSGAMVAARQAPAAGLPRLEAPVSTDRTSSRYLVEVLTHSRVFLEYERAFTEATGLPLALRPVESWQLPLHGKRYESPFCALMANTSRACARCLQMQEKICQEATHEPHTMLCASGLSETAVPVRLGDRLIGFLQTGQVFRHKPTAAQFDRSAAFLEETGLTVDMDQVRTAYFATRVVPGKQQESAMILLKIFAQHLSILSNQVVIQQENAEPPMVTKAKAFIEERYTEDLSLDEVARAVATSPFYFCKKFKQGAGVSFTDYVSRVRIEKAKNLLLNPNLRISEIAYEVGFQSLTHFNRVFRQTLAQSPTEYRGQLIGSTANDAD